MDWPGGEGAAAAMMATLRHESNALEADLLEARHETETLQRRQVSDRDALARARASSIDLAAEKAVAVEALARARAETRAAELEAKVMAEAQAALEHDAAIARARLVEESSQRQTLEAELARYKGGDTGGDVGGSGAAAPSTSASPPTTPATGTAGEAMRALQSVEAEHAMEAAQAAHAHAVEAAQSAAASEARAVQAEAEVLTLRERAVDLADAVANAVAEAAEARRSCGAAESLSEDTRRLSSVAELHAQTTVIEAALERGVICSEITDLEARATKAEALLSATRIEHAAAATAADAEHRELVALRATVQARDELEVALRAQAEQEVARCAEAEAQLEGMRARALEAVAEANAATTRAEVLFTERAGTEEVLSVLRQEAAAHRAATALASSAVAERTSERDQAATERDELSLVVNEVDCSHRSSMRPAPCHQPLVTPGVHAIAMFGSYVSSCGGCGSVRSSPRGASSRCVSGTPRSGRTSCTRSKGPRRCGAAWRRRWGRCALRGGIRS